MSRFDCLHPVLIDLKAQHKAEIDALQAKLEAVEFRVEMLEVASQRKNELFHMVQAQAAKLAEALEGTIEELFSVLGNINRGRCHFDGDRFHERLTLGRKVLAAYKERK